jgi:hypothetical protein
MNAVAASNFLPDTLLQLCTSNHALEKCLTDSIADFTSQIFTHFSLMTLSDVGISPSWIDIACRGLLHTPGAWGPYPGYRISAFSQSKASHAKRRRERVS